MHYTVAWKDGIRTLCPLYSGCGSLVGR